MKRLWGKSDVYKLLFCIKKMSLHRIRIPPKPVHGPNAPRVDSGYNETSIDVPMKEYGKLKQQVVSLRESLLDAQNLAHHWHSKYIRLKAKVASSIN